MTQDGRRERGKWQITKECGYQWLDQLLNRYKAMHNCIENDEFEDFLPLQVLCKRPVRRSRGSVEYVGTQDLYNIYNIHT